MIKKLTANARKPKGLWGGLMIQKMNKGHSRMTGWAFENIRIKKDAAILDVGCGGGNAVYRLAQIASGGKVYGVDYADLCIEQSARKNRREIKTGRVKILKASVSTLPFVENTLDLVTAIETIYFWPDLANDCKEVHRVLRAGGVFAIVCEMVKNGDKNQKHQEVANFLNLHYLTENEIALLLKEAGFQDVCLVMHRENGWLLATGKK